MRHERVDDIVEVDEAEKVLPIVAQVRSSEDGALRELRERVVHGARRREDEHVPRGRDALGATLVAVLEEVPQLGPEEEFADTTHIGDPRRRVLVVRVHHGLMHRLASASARPHGFGEPEGQSGFEEVHGRGCCGDCRCECQHAGCPLELHDVSEQPREDVESARHPLGRSERAPKRRRVRED